MRGHLTAAALVAGLIVPASSGHAAAPNQPAAGSVGSIGIRLVELPAGSNDDPRARSYIVDRLRPGTTIRRRIEISNSTDSTMDVAVYPAAASVHRGRFAFADGHSRNDLSRWTSVSRTVLRLPSGTRASDTVTIKVPKTASSGERYAVVWAEVSAPAPVAGGVRLVNRVGIRIYLSVGPGGLPRADFAIGHLVAKRAPGGEPLVVATVRNTGGSTVDIRGNLTLSRGPGGLRAGPFPVALQRELSPNHSHTIRVRLDDQLPDGPWRADLRLKSGLIERATTATITFPGQARQSAPESVAADSGWPSSRAIALLIALLTIAAALFGLARRRRRSRLAKREPAATSLDQAPGALDPT